MEQTQDLPRLNSTRGSLGVRTTPDGQEERKKEGRWVKSWMSQNQGHGKGKENIIPLLIIADIKDTRFK